MKNLLLALGLFLAPLGSSQAQEEYSHTIVKIGSVEFMNRKPACNPLALAFDPVWVNNWGWTMPRVAWHGMYAGLGLGLERSGEALGLSPRVSGVAVSVSLGLGPHIRQAIVEHQQTGVARINAPDYLYDVVNRSLGLVHSRKGLLIWSALDAGLSCWARP